jgi:hypothetical protein
MSLLDDLDIAILSFVSDFPNSTITRCAKELYNPQDTEALQKKDTMLRHRYKALVSEKLLEKSAEERKSKYTINKARIKFGNAKDLGTKKIIPDYIINDFCIAVFMDDGFIVKSLDKLERKWNSSN